MVNGNAIGVSAPFAIHRTHCHHVISGRVISGYGRFQKA